MSTPLSSNLEWDAAKNQWASQLNPIIASPLSSAVIIKNIPLINGLTVINHNLGRLMQGWWITDINGAATIYRSSPMNIFTLTLTSNAAVVVNIGVF